MVLKNPLVQVENIDVVDLFLSSEKFLPVSQVLSLLRCGFMLPSKSFVIGPGVVRVVTSGHFDVINLW